MKRLIMSGAFENVILLSSKNIGMTEKVIKVGELID